MNLSRELKGISIFRDIECNDSNIFVFKVLKVDRKMNLSRVELKQAEKTSKRLKSSIGQQAEQLLRLEERRGNIVTVYERIREKTRKEIQMDSRHYIVSNIVRKLHFIFGVFRRWNDLNKKLHKKVKYNAIKVRKHESYV